MKPPRMVARRDSSYLHPDWTEEETTMLIDAWSDVESYMKSYTKFAGGVDKHLAAHLSRHGSRARTPFAINCHRNKLYEIVRFINRFDEMQQSRGGRSWFDLSKPERDKLEMSVRIRKTSYALTRESYKTLVKLKSVQKWTKVRHVIAPKPKIALKGNICRPEKCHSCWSASEVKALVRSWSLVLKKSSTSVSAFVDQSSAQPATQYTPWNHCTVSAWRKMKRLATSYLFIRDFNDRRAPAKWFQLSDSEQNNWMDWDSLPADFEDISQDLFDEIHSVDIALAVENATTRSKLSEVEAESSLKALNQVGNSSPLITYWSSPDESVEGAEESPKASTVNPPRPELRTKSPHLLTISPIRIQKGVKQTRDEHQECASFYEHMEQLQQKQFKQAIQRLRTEVERDIRLSTDMARAIFFERLGDPEESGDATFVANLLDEQQRQVRLHFAQFQRKQFYENGYGFHSPKET
ncbi:hypothetical protein PHYPSEUDO_013045 [Phytophthora pseudosyringae]|uniref:Uncharacterized protein n=1 Tax=Phytophthora pseudosyringae TaxID=221518 RepID=A0A8T1V6M8_9STRA|nr:hypothetical protein PHYPSEUDO_013045 [Phytophthora pseudosyringae]